MYALTIFVLSLYVLNAAAFQCYVCNNRAEDDDSMECRDRLEQCPEGVMSCSSVLFQGVDGTTHQRKFCTAPGTPIYQYLMFFPGSAMCQNVETTISPPSGPQPPAPPPGVVMASAPAMPNTMSSNLLCVCTKSKCNGGTYREVMEHVLMQNMKPFESKKNSPMFNKLDQRR